MAVTPGRIEPRYVDAFGKTHAVPRQSIDAIRRAMVRKVAFAATVTGGDLSLVLNRRASE